ncbi:MAG TPA: bifunctional DNA-formamidopyrimidine glycosylase/DNA-(apurinic or apyrimidinic site) lyase [Alphaproteobacteria bacterium]|nr:bifunctional DNA-formamidopyrimidine glycosylase/DNA-(apurinic or apyrimidinic site) lyase [Alphaproteobacteria bacterium]
MPELPEVETVCRGLAAKLEGRVLRRVTAHRPNLRIPLPENLSGRLAGRRVERLERRAKYILIHLDDGMALICHLGMSGRMVIVPAPAPPPGRHDHVVFETEDGTVVTFCDPRRFGLLTMASHNELPEHPLLAGIGPEPLGDDFTPALLRGRLAGRSTPIKVALLDQKVVAGLGNIYVCEALFHAGIAPDRAAASLEPAEFDRLVPAIKAVLGAAIAAGGSSLRDYVQASGELGYFQNAHAVYDRAGRPCPGCSCDSAATGGVQRLVQAGRSTFWCPRRQR